MVFFILTIGTILSADGYIMIECQIVRVLHE